MKRTCEFLFRKCGLCFCGGLALWVGLNKRDDWIYFALGGIIGWRAILLLRICTRMSMTLKEEQMNVLPLDESLSSTAK